MVQSIDNTHLFGSSSLKPPVMSHAVVSKFKCGPTKSIVTGHNIHGVFLCVSLLNSFEDGAGKCTRLPTTPAKQDGCEQHKLVAGSVARKLCVWSASGCDGITSSFLECASLVGRLKSLSVFWHAVIRVTYL